MSLHNEVPSSEGDNVIFRKVSLRKNNGGGFVARTTESGITANSTQTQAGATALTSDFNQVSTSGSAGDAVKLPSAEAGREVIIRNDGANTVQVFPASGDKIDDGSADAVDSNTIGTNSSRTYIAVDATNWYTASNS